MKILPILALLSTAIMVFAGKAIYECSPIVFFSVLIILGSLMLIAWSKIKSSPVMDGKQ